MRKFCSPEMAATANNGYEMRRSSSVDVEVVRMFANAWANGAKSEFWFNTYGGLPHTKISMESGGGKIKTELETYVDWETVTMFVCALTGKFSSSTDYFEREHLVEPIEDFPFEVFKLQIANYQAIFKGERLYKGVCYAHYTFRLYRGEIHLFLKKTEEVDEFLKQLQGPPQITIV